MAEKFSEFKRILTLSILLMLSLSARPASSDSINYIYDNLGRLSVAVSSSGDAIIYNYDQAGRLISTTRTVTGIEPPVIHSISPGLVYAGRNAIFQIFGENLSTITEITADNAEFNITSYKYMGTYVELSAFISNSAEAGITNLHIKNLFGEGWTQVRVLKVRFTPSFVEVVEGFDVEAEVAIDGSDRDLYLTVINENPENISVPTSVYVPAGQEAVFKISALWEGYAVVSAENSNLSVNVLLPFARDAIATAGPVSVGFENAELASSGAYSKPISVKIDRLWMNDNILITTPLSVRQGYLGDGTVTNPLVSVKKP